MAPDHRGAILDKQAGVARQLLSSLLRRPVVDSGGRRLGRLRDVTVLLDRSHPLVHRAIVDTPTGDRALPWPHRSTWDGGRLVIAESPEEVPRTPVHGEPALEAHELLLGRDVLDTQVVDLAGHRLSRVSDVLLVAPPGGGLEVAAVDVGLGGLLRRMGLRRLAERLGPAAIDWQDLHLTSSRGHVVQLSTATAGMHRLDAAELAELLARLSPEKATDVMRTVGPERSARALHRSHPAVGRRLLHTLGHEEARRVVVAAPPGAASDRLAELHGQVAQGRRRRYLRTAGWRVRRPPHRRGGDVTSDSSGSG